MCSSDLSIKAATVVQSAVLIAAAWRIIFGLGVPKQHQTAHDGFRRDSNLTELIYCAVAKDKVTRTGSVRK